VRTPAITSITPQPPDAAQHAPALTVTRTHERLGDRTERGGKAREGRPKAGGRSVPRNPAVLALRGVHSTLARLVPVPLGPNAFVLVGALLFLIVGGQH